MWIIDRNHVTELSQIYREITVDYQNESFFHEKLGYLTHSSDLEHRSGILFAHLSRFIYLYYHARDYKAAKLLINGAKVTKTVADWEERRFVDRLSRAHDSRWQISDGWSLAPDKDGFVFRDGLSIKLDSVNDFKHVDSTTVSLKMPPILRYTLPGWAIFVGEEGAGSKHSVYIRYYFAINNASTAVSLLANLSKQLNHEGIPYHIKIANNQHSLKRSDSFILYGEFQNHNQLNSSTTVALTNTRLDASKPSPLFSTNLGGGRFYAVERPQEHPGQSFGQACSSAIAKIIIENSRAVALGKTPYPFSKWLNEISDEFIRSGLNFDPNDV